MSPLIHSYTVLRTINKHDPEKYVPITNKKLNKNWISNGIKGSINKSKKMYKE